MDDEAATATAQQRRLDHIGRDLLDAHQRYQRQALDLMRQRGYTQLTPALIGLVPHLDLDGTPLSEVAARSVTTRQAVGQLVDELARLGLVTKERDEADRRAIVVRFTPAGRKLVADAIQLKEQIEADYRKILGKKGLEDLRTLLRKLNQA